MSADVLIDTNIMVYAYDPQSGIKQQQAIDTLDHLIRTKRAAVSVQTLSEFIVVATRKIEPPLSDAELLQTVDRMSRSITVLPLTDFVVREAVRGMQTYQLSYWDAQIWAIAHLNQIPTIYTEDLPAQPYIEGVRYKNPLADD